MDLGDRRRPPLVPSDTIEAQVRSPEVCGFLCMDSHSKVVQPCIPSCKCEEVELQQQTDVDESTGTNGLHQREVIHEEYAVHEPDEEHLMETTRKTYLLRITDTLVVTVIALLVTMSVLRQLGYSFDASIDNKSTSNSGLEGALPLDKMEMVSSLTS